MTKLRDIVRRRRTESPVPSFGGYPLALLRERITRVLRERAGQMDMTWEIDFLDRVKFGADFAVRLTGLLKEYGAKKYIESHAPWIAEALAGSELADVVAEVTRKGIYINVRLTGFHPSPTSHAVVSFRFLGRLMQGPVVRATDRRHSLRLDVLTMTRSAYVQVRRAVVAR